MKVYPQRTVPIPAPDRNCQFLKFLSVGLMATAVHYFVLTAGIEVIGIKLASIASLIASLSGIFASFLGNRYFVFRNNVDGIVKQALRFSTLYTAIAFLHTTVLLIWTDWMGLDYRIGFLLATATQVLITYNGNRLLVFRT